MTYENKEMLDEIGLMLMYLIDRINAGRYDTPEYIVEDLREISLKLDGIDYKG